jgi:ATP-dependent DNA helicase RecQ
VVPCATAADRRRRLIAALSEPGALPAIVYAGTRGNCEDLAVALGSALGEEVLAYHAGLDRTRRHDAQERFMSGQARVIVATNAFGMGIDKADVRTVAHASVPGSLEAYYQEAGRAGRDGRPARALLFVEQRDKGLHVFFIQRSRLEDAAFERVGERLAWAGMDGRYDLALGELAGLAGIGGADADGARAIIGHLSRAGIVTPEPSAPDRAVGRLVGAWDRRALALCRSSARDAERVRWNQYRSVWDYVERTGCRRAALLDHFGDPTRSALEVPCCDVCDPAAAPAGPPPMAAVSRSRGARARSAGGGGSRARRPGGGVESVPTPGELDEAIMDVIGSARPPVGRTRAVEILRGGRSKVIAEHAYDDLPAYGTFAHLRADDVLGRVDQLLAKGTLHSTGGRFPKLRAA